ncbi:MAG: ABC transporter ATP-binding protein [Gracilibacteraceae bacterium]|jgi:ABC-2 type transport system ATP-binding protein/Cu-processing system ATP-binding protein|nr:ABC transporter ATP-binding protein [Gracilibacteraceae bacterium]
MGVENILRVERASKTYGAYAAVNEVDLEIPRGEIFALLGHNGAGKSTLIKIILGLAQPGAGSVLIEGCTYRQNRLETRMKVGYLPERLSFYDNLTAWETICFYAKLKGINESQCEAVLAEVGLGDAMHKRVGAYSKGMQQRLGLAQAIVHRPSLLILDEPTTGLDPSGVLWLKEKIRAWNKAGTTIFFSSHNLGDVEELAHRVGIMCKGRLDVVGTMAELQKQYGLKATLRVMVTEPPGADLEMFVATQSQQDPRGPVWIREEGNRLVMTCEAHEKGWALESLLEHGIRFTDFRVEEPGLDAIYREVMSGEAN